MQALCPEKVKRGLETFQQRPTVHQLPRNPLQAHSGGSSSAHNPLTFPKAQSTGASPASFAPSHSQNVNVSPSNLLGIHMVGSGQQQWRQQTDRSGSTADMSLSYCQGQQQIPHNQVHPYLSSTQQQHQQQYLNSSHGHVASPYKVYCPQMNMATNASANLDPADYERPELPQRSSDYSAHPGVEAFAGRVGLHRSATHSGAAEELHRHAGYHAPPGSQQGDHGDSGACTPSWPRTQQQEPSSTLPKDIWAPAPKRPTLIRVDPEDVSSEKRTKPQPIGTRSAAIGASSATAGESTSATAEAVNNTEHKPNKTGAPGKNDTLETVGRKDIDWISDSLTFATCSAPASS